MGSLRLEASITSYCCNQRFPGHRPPPSFHDLLCTDLQYRGAVRSTTYAHLPIIPSSRQYSGIAQITALSSSPTAVIPLEHPNTTLYLAVHSVLENDQAISVASDASSIHLLHLWLSSLNSRCSHHHGQSQVESSALVCTTRDLFTPRQPEPPAIRTRLFGRRRGGNSVA